MKRLITGTVLVLLMLALILWAQAGITLAFLALLLLGAAWEWRGLLEPHIAPQRRWIYAILSLLIVFLVYENGYLNMATKIVAGLLPLWAVVDCFVLSRPSGKQHLFLGYLLGWLYWLGLAGGAVLFISEGALGRERFLASMAIIWLADSGAYWVGSKWGRHKLAPALSPKKSWEGVIGAFALPTLALLLTMSFGWSGAGLPMSSYLLAILILVPIGILGDLWESAYKRASGLKDSGRLLPGHGGILDRIDALLLTVPVSVWLLL